MTERQEHLLRLLADPVESWSNLGNGDRAAVQAMLDELARVRRERDAMRAASIEAGKNILQWTGVARRQREKWCPIHTAIDTSLQVIEKLATALAAPRGATS